MTLSRAGRAHLHHLIDEVAEILGRDPAEVTAVLLGDEYGPTVTTKRAAEILSLGVDSADKRLRRRGLTPVGRQPGRGGQNLWRTADVAAARAAAPGQGARTDLKNQEQA